MVKPIAVLISDVHYSVQTLELADASVNLAITKANRLGVPLIVAGDLHDTKANMRAECVNAMIETFKNCMVDCYILRGNHDQINEKSEQHSLNFLSEIKLDYDIEWETPARIEVIDSPNYWGRSVQNLILIPYHHDAGELKSYLKTLPKGSTLIMHQGLQGSDSGDYIQDKSALTHKDVKAFRVISGHYHRRQDIKTGRPQKNSVGLFSYIGNPYTLSFGEASHPEKGFQILMDDGTLEFVPTNLKKHVIIEIECYNDSLITGATLDDIKPNDLVRVRLSGTKEQLSKYNKSIIAKKFGIENFRLDLMPNDQESKASEAIKALPNPELLDSLIPGSEEQKARLKSKWRGLCE